MSRSIAHAAAPAGLFSLVVLATGLLVGAARSEPETLDRVIAVVGDEIILQSEVEEEVYLAQLRGEIQAGDAEAVKRYRAEVLDAMIDGKILYAQARAEGIRLTREEIDRAIDGMIGELEQRFPSEAALEAQLASEGTSLVELRADYRDRVEEQLMARRLVDRNVRGSVSVDEREIRVYWEENRDQIPNVPALLDLRRILVRFDAVAAIDSAAVERAEIVRRRLREGEDFATLATVFSEGPTAQRGGDLGWFRPSDLEPTLRDAVRSIGVGEITDVVITQRGAHILTVEDQRGDELKLRQIVFLRDDEAAKAAARARAESIHARLRAGEDFVALARAESDDEFTRDDGGSIGQVPVQSLAPAYRLTLESLEPGEISGVLEDEEGFSIFRVDAKEGEHEPTYEEVRDRLANLLQQQKAQERYLEYVDTVREGIYVENRLTAES